MDMLRWAAPLGAVLLLGQTALAQKFEGLARTPQLGWNSWNKFACNVSEQMIRETADAMVASGMKARRLPLRQHRRLLARRARRAGLHSARQGALPLRDEGAGRLRAREGARARHLLRRRAGRPAAGKPGSRGHEYQDALTLRRMGHRLPQVRLVQHQRAQAPRRVSDHARRPARRRDVPSSSRLCEWGDNQPWKLGEGRRALLAHDRRHHRLLRLRRRPRHLEIAGRAADPRQAGRPARLRRSRPLERPGHARGGQRHVGHRGPRALLDLGDDRGAAHRRQRPPHDVEGDHRDS